MMRMRWAILTSILIAVLLSNWASVPRQAMAQQQLPDLVVLKAWQSSSQICYTIKNIGEGSIGSAVAPASYYSALYIDGKQVAEDHITTILAPGQQLDRFFSYQFQMTPPQHTIRVCADWRQNITESNEQNNCWEEVWVIEEQKLPDLIVERIECGPDNKLSVTIKNIGSGAIPSGWKALAEAYFGGARKGAFDMTYPTSILNGGIDMPGGSSVYLPGWDITAPVTVMVTVDITDEIKESNDQNNTGEDRVEPLVTRLPDLVIEEIKCDRMNSRIGYVIKNIGEEQAEAGHTITLYVGDKEVCHEVVNIDLKPGATCDSWFKEYKWPEYQTIKVRVCTDNDNQVKELDEQNNCLDKVCESVADTAPPQIVSGPTISEITQTSAAICWVTDEVSDSLVRYDHRSGKYGTVIEDISLVQEHCLNLSNLVPATIYHFMVESSDSSRNKVKSRDISFETLSPADKQSPSLSLQLPDTISGRVTISATTQDDTGVDRVVFYLDGEPVYTDFAPPFTWKCETTECAGGSHQFGAQSFDAAGNVAEDVRDSTVRNPLPDTDIPAVTILNPRTGDSVIGSVPIEAEAHDEGYIKAIKLYIDGVYKHGWTYTKTYLEGILVPPPESKTLTYSWDVSSLEADSEHVIEVKAWDGDDNCGRDSLRVTKARIEAAPQPVTIEPLPMPPSVDLRRYIERYDNYFEVTLEIENTGTVPVRNVIIEDHNRGFQSLWGEDLCEITYSASGKWSTVEIGYTEELAPGETALLQYYAVPVLFDPYRLSDYEIGYARTALWCEAHESIYSLGFYLPFTPGPDGLDVEAALHSADYLIVTNPYNLFATNSSHDDVNRLLCTMADLAKEKQGVLGYLYAPLSMPTSLDGNDALTLGDFNNDGKDDILKGVIGGDNEGLVDLYGIRGWFGNLRLDVNRRNGLAVGDVLGDDTPDIVSVGVLSPTSKWATVYEGYSTDGTMKDTKLGEIQFQVPPCQDFGDDDAIILGDVVGDSKKEIIFGVREEGVIVCYYDSARGRWLKTSTWFYDGDAMAVGDVWGDEKEEIIVANHRDGTVHGFTVLLDGDELTVGGAMPTPPTCYGSGDALALGDINRDFKEEIIVGDRDSGRVEVYHYDNYGSNLLFSVDTSFDRGDVLAVGDVCGRSDAMGMEEIIVAEDGGGTKGWVYIYSHHGAYIPHLATSFGTSFSGDDYLLIGDVTGDDFEEIVIGNRGGREKGLIEIVSVMEGAPRDRERLQELTREGGEWCVRLCPDWADEGYLLLVGETEIIPSFTARWADKNIHYTDYPYASTCGQDKFPELSIGRIIGNTAAELIIPIQNSLDVWRGAAHFDRNNTPRADAYGVSGHAKYWQERRMWNGLCDICGWIDNEFYVVKYRGEDHSGDWIVNNFTSQTIGRDIIIYRGHGYNDGSGWAWGGDTSLGRGHLLGYWEYKEEDGTWIWHDPVVDFSSARPFVFSLSCSAGKYAGISGIAEAFLQRGAAVYIASTETSYTQDNNEGGDKFFEKWIGHHGHPDKTIGQAWKETRHWASDEWWGEGSTYWGAEYQLYGDPKYGKER